MAGGGVAPYARSWVDRLTAWVSALPVPAWLIYLLLFGLLALPAVLALNANGISPRGLILQYFLLSAFSPVYFLALIHFLDQSAAEALSRFRPVMTCEPQEYARLCYRLTTLPAWPALIAPALGTAYALITLLLNRLAGYNPGQGAIPVSLIPMDIGYRLLVSALAALMAYHTIHKLRLVSQTYTQHTNINLFRLGPLYALSNLAARTAIGISIPTYLWLWFNTSTTRGLTLADLLPTVFFSLVILAAFIWPLLGAHRLLVQEKQRLLGEVSGRIETTIQDLHAMIDARELGEYRGSLKDTLDGLLLERGLIARLPTWPWRSETAGSVGAAFLLPIIIWIVQRLLERLGV